MRYELEDGEEDQDPKGGWRRRRWWRWWRRAGDGGGRRRQALGDLMGMSFSGAAGGYIGWCISYLATLGIFMKLLDMDFGEVLMCSSFIFIIRTWVVTALLIALLHGFGINVPMGGGGFGFGG